MKLFLILCMYLSMMPISSQTMYPQNNIKVSIKTLEAQQKEHKLEVDRLSAQILTNQKLSKKMREQKQKNLEAHKKEIDKLSILISEAQNQEIETLNIAYKQAVEKNDTNVMVAEVTMISTILGMIDNNIECCRANNNYIPEYHKYDIDFYNCFIGLLNNDQTIVQHDTIPSDYKKMIKDTPNIVSRIAPFYQLIDEQTKVKILFIINWYIKYNPDFAGIIKILQQYPFYKENNNAKNSLIYSYIDQKHFEILKSSDFLNTKLKQYTADCLRILHLYGKSNLPHSQSDYFWLFDECEQIENTINNVLCITTRCIDTKSTTTSNILHIAASYFLLPISFINNSIMRKIIYFTNDLPIFSCVIREGNKFNVYSKDSIIILLRDIGPKCWTVNNAEAWTALQEQSIDIYRYYGKYAISSSSYISITANPLKIVNDNLCLEVAPTNKVSLTPMDNITYIQNAELFNYFKTQLKNEDLCNNKILILDERHERAQLEYDIECITGELINLYKKHPEKYNKIFFLTDTSQSNITQEEFAEQVYDSDNDDDEKFNELFDELTETFIEKLQYEYANNVTEDGEDEEENKTDNISITEIIEEDDIKEEGEPSFDDEDIQEHIREHSNNQPQVSREKPQIPLTKKQKALQDLKIQAKEAALQKFKQHIANLPNTRETEKEKNRQAKEILRQQGERRIRKRLKQHNIPQMLNALRGIKAVKLEASTGSSHGVLTVNGNKATIVRQHNRDSVCSRTEATLERLEAEAVLERLAAQPALEAAPRSLSSTVTFK